LKQDSAKALDINAIETALYKLLELYRQALRAAEFLPVHGRVPDNEHLVEITQVVGPRRRRISHLRLQFIIHHADWIRSRFAVRFLARMFLRSHIRSKLRAIADRLEVEQLASGSMNSNTLKRLDTIITKLRDYDRLLTPRKTGWLKLPGGIWAVVVPLLATYLGTRLIPSLEVSVVGVLVRLGMYLLSIGILVWFPSFNEVALGGFRWKRLILLGQTGDVNIEVATNVVLRWAPAPQANTYESENHVFETLGLPKPSEFPWDIILSPTKVLSGLLALGVLILALAFIISAIALNLGWPLLIAVVFLFVFFFCLYDIRRSILRVMRERKLRSAC